MPSLDRLAVLEVQSEVLPEEFACEGNVSPFEDVHLGVSRLGCVQRRECRPWAEVQSEVPQEDPARPGE